MSPRSISAALAAACLLTSFTALAAGPDLIVHHAKIATADAAFSIREAIERLAGAYARGATDDVLIFGSLYLAGEVLAANGEIPD